MFSLLYAHPYGRHSYVNQHLIKAVRTDQIFDVRDLYQMYPDFYIDVKQEQLALQKSAVIILQFPVQSGFPPALLVQYINKIFCPGWAWGNDKQKLPTQHLVDKTLLVVLSGVGRAHEQPSTELVIKLLQQLAHRCGMKFASPILVPLRRLLAEQELAQITIQYQVSLQHLLQQHLLKA